MALVDVIYARFDAEFLQQPHSPHAEQNLLLDPRPLVAAVQAVGYPPVLGGVRRDIGVQEIKRSPADLDFPDVGKEDASGQFERNLRGIASIVLH